MIIHDEAAKLLRKGAVIPAMPLVLNKARRLDERRQRGLVRYYLDAGAGGIAAGVHTTQFAIRQPDVNLYEPVLKIAASECDSFERYEGRHLVRVAGVIGRTSQAVKEAAIAADHGYNAVLLSLGAFMNEPNSDILKHCRRVAAIMPLFGFYLQPAVGGRILNKDFWKEFAAIENVVAIKIAPFNRYQTLDVLRGVAESGRAGNIALYTGNDDNILVDLLTEYEIVVNGDKLKKNIVGGLLGHWAVWTKRAVELLDNVQNGCFAGDTQTALSLAAKITDCNAAFFDAANGYKGCITGIHEVLRRQGLLEGIWTLEKDEDLSPGQREEIDRVYADYPELNDDEFVKENIRRWLD